MMLLSFLDANSILRHRDFFPNKDLKIWYSLFWVWIWLVRLDKTSFLAVLLSFLPFEPEASNLMGLLNMGPELDEDGEEEDGGRGNEQAIGRRRFVEAVWNESTRDEVNVAEEEKKEEESETESE